VHQNRARYSSSISETLDLYLCLLYLDEMRHVYFTRVSAHLGFVTGIKQRPLPQLVTCFSGLTGDFGNGHENRARYCEINIGDACCEPTSPLSRRNETHLFPRASAVSQLKETRAFNSRLLYLGERARSWGPPVRIGNGLLHYPLHCWHVCNGLSE
jgi:hypothetical protein